MTVARVYHDRLYENDGIPALIGLVGPSHRRILDIGCGNGANMRLLASTGHEVVGVTLSEKEAFVVRAAGLECHVCDVERDEISLPDGSFDGLLFSHVLEHMAWPSAVLMRHLRLLRPGGAVFMALPNVLQFRQRWEFLRGRFQYTEMGLMDRTHLRFFDFETAADLLSSAGLTVTAHVADGHMPLGPLRRALGPAAPRLDAFVSRRWPGFFGYHLLVVGRFGPPVG